MFGFFKSNNPGVIIFYLVYLILFRICIAFVDIDTSFVFEHKEPLSLLVFGWLKAIPVDFKITGAVLSTLLTFLQAVMINRIINNNKMTSRKNYLGGLVFIIFASFFKEGLILSPASIALTFIIPATGKLFGLMRKEKLYGDIFDVGMLVALASLFYLPAIAFIIFAYIGLSTVRPFAYREWAAMSLGFLAPLFVAFTAYYFLGTRPEDMLPYKNGFNLSFSNVQWIQLGVFMLFSAVSFVLLPGFLYSSLIQVRKFTTMLILVFFFTILTFFLQQHFSLSHLVFLSMPVGIITAMILFQLKSGLISEVAHLVLVLLVLGGQFLPLFNLI